MNVNIVIQRRYTKAEQKLIQPLLDELCQLVYNFGGFVSGDAFVDIDDSSEHLIISTWKSLGHWRQYHQAGRVVELCSMIDAIISKQTVHRVFVPEQDARSVA